MNKLNTDPICGMSVSADTPHQLKIEGIQYYFCSDKCLHQFEAETAKKQDSGQTTDPVCGMKVTVDGSHHTTYKGQHYHFCSPGCMEKFNANPDQYV